MFIVFGNSAMYVIMFSIDNMMQEITDAFQSLWMFIHSSFPLLPHLYRIAKFCFICCTEQRYPDAETLKPSCVWTENKIKRLKRRQQRLSGYRSLTFWAHPDITRLVRRPLASCTYDGEGSIPLIRWWLRVCWPCVFIILPWGQCRRRQVTFYGVILHKLFSCIYMYISLFSFMQISFIGSKLIKHPVIKRNIYCLSYSCE